MPKKKKDLPVFVVLTIPNWKSNILQFMLKLLLIKGKPYVITIQETDLVTDGKGNYERA